MFNAMKRPGGKKGIFFIVMCTLICVWEGCGDQAINKQIDSNVKTVVDDDNRAIDEHGTTEVFDEAVSVVGLYLKAQLSRDTETALTYCADSLKGEVRDGIEEANAYINSTISEQMDTYASVAQMIFNSIGNDTNSIDAEYLYNDSDMEKACKDLAESMYINTRIYSLPEKAEMISDREAVVAIDFAAKYLTEIEYSMSEDIVAYLENAVLEKLMDDPGFIKEQIAKKIVKEILINHANDLKSKYEETIDEILIRKKIYYLTKESEKWLISKIDIEDFSNNYYGEESGEEDYYENEYEEDEYEEEQYEGAYDDYYENESTAQYILPYSNNEYLSEDDLEGLTAQELTYARNEIFARHGYVFESNELNNYFEQMDWYEADPDYDGVLSDIERNNAELILSYQQENDLMYKPQ